MLRYLLTLAVALVAMSSVCEAQYNNKKKQAPFLHGFYACGGIGTNVFFGDVQDGSRFRFGLDLSARKEINKYVTARVDIDGGQLSGEADWGAEFKTIYFDFTGGVDFMFLNLIAGYYSGRLVEPYISAGVGLLMFKPDNSYDYSGAMASIGRLDKFKDLNSFTAAPMVYGVVGGRYNINRHWAANLEFKGFLPFGSNSDKLDGQDSKQTVDFAYDEESGDYKAGMFLGENKYDVFYTIMVGCSYKFADSKFRTSSKYNRKTYMRNRKTYKRNANRQRRR